MVGASYAPLRALRHVSLTIPILDDLCGHSAVAHTLEQTPASPVASASPTPSMRENMRTPYLISGLVAAALLSSAAIAQTTKSQNTNQPAAKPEPAGPKTPPPPLAGAQH